MLAWRSLCFYDGLRTQGWRAWPDDLVAQRIDRVLRSWDETPYMLGQCAKGVGVDCIRYVCAVLNELYGRDNFDFEHLPGDSDMFNREGAERVLRKVIRMYPATQILGITDESWVEPGDVIITAKPGCGPGHSIFVGNHPRTLWHAIDGGVQEIDIDEVGGGHPKFTPYRIMRMSDKETWQ